MTHKRPTRSLLRAISAPQEAAEGCLIHFAFYAARRRESIAADEAPRLTWREDSRKFSALAGPLWDSLATEPLLSADENPAGETATEGGGRAFTAVVLCASFLLALVVRTWAVGYRGVIGFDETYYYILGRNLLTGHGYTLNGLPHAAFPPLYPLLVGLASLISRDMRFATSAVSALGGALVVVPVYFLARDVHSRLVGAIAAFAAAAWPALWFFASLSVPYNWKLYAGSEPLYVTLFTFGVLFLWRFARRGGWGKAVLAGAAFGLASLVRSEGPVVFALLFLWLVADGVVSRRIFKARAVAQTVLLGAAMVVAFSPWLVYMHGVTGRWTLGPKLANKTKIREAFWLWTASGDNLPFLDIHYKLNADADWMEEPYWGVSEWHRQKMAASSALAGGAGAVAHPEGRWVAPFVGFFWRGRMALIPWYAWVFIVAGLLSPPWTAVRLRWWGLVAAGFLIMLFMAVSVGALPRNELWLLPLAAVGTAKGLASATRALLRVLPASLGAKPAVRAVVCAIPAAVVIAAMLKSGVDSNISGARRGPHVDAGLRWQRLEIAGAAELAADIPPGATLMCMKPWIAVASGLDWRVTPMDTQERILHYALARGIDYALLEPWQLGSSKTPEALAPYFVREFDWGAPYLLFDFTRGRATGR